MRAGADGDEDEDADMRAAMPPDTPRPVVVMAHQQPHYQRLTDALTRSKLAIDMSETGSGKTYVATALCGTMDIKHVVVIAPKTTLTKWSDMVVSHGLRADARHLLNFASLKACQASEYGAEAACKHGLLTRRTTMVEGKKVVDIQPTAEWLRMVEEGVVVVVDEFQNVKNLCNQTHTVRELIAPIMASPGPSPSRVLMMSASPIDKKEQATTFFKLIGAMPASAGLCKNVKGPLNESHNEWSGMNGIYDFCHALDAETTDRVTGGSRGAKAAELREVVFELFNGVLGQKLSSSMRMPANGLVLLRRNAMYEVRDEADRKGLQDAVDTLKSCCGYNEERKQVAFCSDATGQLTAIGAALQNIEAHKVGTFVRAARSALGASPTAKVVIAVNYTKTVAALAEALGDYAPLLLTGDTELDQRGVVVKRFGEGNADRRLLICIIQVSNTGIDLDDKHGGFPRLMLVSPNYSAINLFQLAARMMRANTKSDATVSFVYAKHATEEPVLSALANKSEVMRSVAPGQAEQLADLPTADADAEEQAQAQAQ